MTGGRRSAVARLMAGVALVAANLAAASALPVDANRALLAGVAPIGLALQAGILLLLRARGRGRAFRAGFIAAGGAALASFAVAMTVTARFVGKEGPRGRPILLPGPPWAAYDAFVFDALERHLMGLGVRQGTNALFVAELVIYCVPQLLIALAGGLLGLLVRGLGAGHAGRGPEAGPAGRPHPARGGPSQPAVFPDRLDRSEGQG